jgi:hypothetical protein
VFWHADLNDPYDILDENHHNGRRAAELVARNPGGEWVDFDDLPKATQKALRQRDKRWPYEICPFYPDASITMPPVAEHSFLERTDPCVLVQGPGCGDAQFYGEWLLAASKIEAFWKEAYADQDFQRQIGRVCVCQIPDFGIFATALTVRLMKDRTIVLQVDGEAGVDFAIMATMGFFIQKDTVYRMSLPPLVTSEEVRAAILKYVKTQDSEFVLHPEYIVTTLPFSEANSKQLRRRLASY